MLLEFWILVTVGKKDWKSRLMSVRLEVIHTSSSLTLVF